MAMTEHMSEANRIVDQLSFVDLPEDGPLVYGPDSLLEAIVQGSDSKGRYYGNAYLLRRLFWWQDAPPEVVGSWRDELVRRGEITVEPIGRCCYTDSPVPIISIVNRRRFERFAEREFIPDSIRREVYDRDGWRCLYCGTDRDLSLDHITPWSKGGPDTPDNLQTLCRPCNSGKGARV